MILEHDNADYLTLLPCVEPNQWMAAVMSYSASSDDYQPKTLGPVESHDSAWGRLLRWAHELKLERR